MRDDQPPDDPIIRLEQVRSERRAQARVADHPDTPPEYSDDALALKFAERHVDKLRHVAVWGKWLLWRGSHWQTDDTMRAFDLARVICRDAGAGVQAKKLAAAIASAKTVAAVVSMARSDRRLAETVDVWDCDQGLLNTPVTTIPLKIEKEP